MDLKDTYNKIARDWFNEVNASHWWEEGLAQFVSFLKPGDTVLDAGCGPGITAKYFIKNNIKVLGIDFSEKMIEIAKKEVPQGNFLVMDIKEVGKLQDRFDGIYVQNILLHIPKKEVGGVLENMVKLLKAGGVIYISVKEKAPDGPEEFIKVDNDYGYKIERFFSCFTQEEIKQYVKNLNLEIVFFNIVEAGKTRWIQVIGKKSL